MEEPDNVYDQMIEDYTQKINSDPENAAAYYNKRGVCYYNKGDYDQAIADCTKAIEVDPNYHNAYDNRGVSYHKKEMYGKAIEDYSKAIELNPSYANSYYNLSCNYCMQNDKEKALAYFRIALEKGFSDFDHLELDDDLNLIREEQEFKNLIEEYKEPLDYSIGMF